MRTRTRVKICGVTTAKDALLAADAGADAVGLNFHPPSPRALDLPTARRIARALPPFVAAVGVFVDPRAELVESVLEAVPLGCLQFHGDEAAGFCRSFGLPYIKAIGVAADFHFDAKAEAYDDAHALLLDSGGDGARGGTGRTFDWGAWPDGAEQRLILAGGLNPDNVGAAVAATRPYAVDVASGVEGAVKGRKDPCRVRRFFEAVARA